MRMASTLRWGKRLAHRLCGDKPLSIQGAAVTKIAYTLARGLARKAPQLSRGAVPELEQRTDEFLVVAPAADGILVNRLPHLPVARGPDHPLGPVKLEAARIPWELEKVHDPAGPLLLSADESCVGDFEQDFGREHTAPMVHEAPMLVVVVRQVGKVHGEVQRRQERLEITGQAGIDRITSQVDDACLGKYRMDDAEIV